MGKAYAHTITGAAGAVIAAPKPAGVPCGIGLAAAPARGALAQASLPATAIADRRAVCILFALVAFALAVVVALFAPGAVPAAFAADTGAVTIEAQQEAHSYSAYRIVAGEVAADGTMSDFTYTGCMQPSFYTALAQAMGVDDFETPQDTAEAIAQAAENDAEGTFAVQLSRLALREGAGGAQATFATGETVQLDAGWWLFISDSAQPILAVVGAGPLVVSEKSLPPAVTKQVGEAGSDGAVTYGNVADSSFSTGIPYRLEGTLPSNYAAYDAFAYAFVDELEAGLVADPESVAVTLVSADGSEQVVAEGFAVSYQDQVLRVAFDELKTALPQATYGDRIRVDYTAQLDPANATLGFAQGNDNTVQLEYTRSPSYDATGLTAPSAATVYAYGIQLVKVSSADQNPLAGAVFVLKGADGRYLAADGTWTSDAQAAARTTDDAGAISFAGLDAGSYTISELSAPDGYQRLEGDIPVRLTVDQGTKTLSVSIYSRASNVVSVDAGAGMVSLSVKNKPVTSRGFLPKTGDVLRATGVAALVAAVAALVATAVRRKRAGEEDARG